MLYSRCYDKDVGRNVGACGRTSQVAIIVTEVGR